MKTVNEILEKMRSFPKTMDGLKEFREFVEQVSEMNNEFDCKSKQEWLDFQEEIKNIRREIKTQIKKNR